NSRMRKCSKRRRRTDKMPGRAKRTQKILQALAGLLFGMNVQPITLTGCIVRLEPLSLAHVPDLTLAGGDETIWRYLPFALIRTQEDMTALVQDQLARQTQGSEIPFAVISLETGRAIGCTRYMDIQQQHCGLEIGGTWYAREHQRTGVNTECKYQLLR